MYTEYKVVPASEFLKSSSNKDIHMEKELVIL